MTKKPLKLNTMLKLAGILLCLVLATTHLASNLYAKYTSSDSGGDSARVAVWNVEASGSSASDVKIDLATAATDNSTVSNTYALTVTNKSEVASNYDIIVVFDKALSDEITLTLDGGAKTATTTDNNKEFVFSNVGQLGVGNTSAAHTLTFAANYADVDVDYSYEFNVKVDFEQID